MYLLVDYESFDSNNILAQLLSQIRTVPPENQFRIRVKPSDPWFFYGGLLFDSVVLASTGCGLVNVLATVLAVASSPYVVPVALGFALFLGLVLFIAQYVASNKKSRLKTTQQQNHEKSAYKEVQFRAYLSNFNVLYQAYSNSNFSKLPSRDDSVSSSSQKSGTLVPFTFEDSDSSYNIGDTITSYGRLFGKAGKGTPEANVDNVLKDLFGSAHDPCGKSVKDSSKTEETPTLPETKDTPAKETSADDEADALVSKLRCENMSKMLSRKTEQEIDTARKSSKKSSSKKSSLGKSSQLPPSPRRFN